jgi:hypothetical protein
VCGEINFFNKEGQRVTRKVENDELTDILKAMVAPLSERQLSVL